MKTAVVFIIILVLIVGGLIYFWPKEGIKQSVVDILKAEKRELAIDKIDQTKKIVYLEHKIDSLESIPDKIKERVVYLQSEVDSAIAIDSSNSIQEYRKGLVLLDIRPDLTLRPTYREIGLGALIFRETYGLRLNVVNLNETNIELHNSIKQHKVVIILGDSIQVIDSLTIIAQDLIIKQLDSWWRHRFSVNVGAGISWIPNYGIQPSIGIQAGVNLWRNE